MNYNFKTSCKDCVFAEYSDDTQTGCEAKRLQLLETVECYDNEKEFFVVGNKA